MAEPREHKLIIFGRNDQAGDYLGKTYSAAESAGWTTRLIGDDPRRAYESLTSDIEAFIVITDDTARKSLRNRFFGQSAVMNEGFSVPELISMSARIKNLGLAVVTNKPGNLPDASLDSIIVPN